MKKVKEVSELTGLTKRALQYYDEKGLLMTKRSKQNHRLYDDESIERLWEILFCKEMGFELEEIKDFINSSEEKKEEILNGRIEVIEEKKKGLENNIILMKRIRKEGLPHMYSLNKYENSMTFVEQIKMWHKTLVKRQENLE